MKGKIISQRYDKQSNNSNQRSVYSMNINSIPFAKSYENLNLKSKNNSNLTSMAKLPPIPRTQLQDNKYKQAYENFNQAKSLIQTRLNKLMYEKKSFR